MQVDYIEIDKALDYYGIHNDEYKNKCYKCTEDINKISNFNTKSEEVYNILYTNKSFSIDICFNIQECDNYNMLVENTTLQKLLKQQLLQNKEFRIGCGKLKNEYLNDK